MKLNLFFQGDIMFKRVDKLPKNVKQRKAENGQYIIARGEATGHNHVVIAEPKVKLFDAPDGGMYLQVEQATEIVHTSGNPPEHNTITIGKQDLGTFYIMRQMEYQHGQATRIAD